jgi:hypothetical protein
MGALCCSLTPGDPVTTLRQLAPLCLLSLLACTTAQPNKPVAPVEPPEQEVDIEALGRRDGLFEVGEGHQPNVQRLVGVAWAELDGAPPRELVIHTQPILGYPSQLWFYDVTVPGDPRQLSAPQPYRFDHEGKRAEAPSWTSYEGISWWLAEDLDQDGRAEVIILVERGGGMSVELHVLGWGERASGEGLVERLWHQPWAAGVVLVDVDGDGRREIAAIVEERYSRREIALVVLEADARGFWRPRQGEIGAWLPPVLDALVADRRATMHMTIPALMTLMRRHGAAPRDLAALQAALVARVEEARRVVGVRATERSRVEQRFLYDAMAWAGNLAAYDALLRPVTEPGGASLVMDALLELDALNGQTRGREALLGWLEGALAGPLREQEQEIRQLLHTMQRHGVGEGAARVVKTLGDGAREVYERERLLSFVWPSMLSEQRALWALEPALRDEWLTLLGRELGWGYARSWLADWRVGLDVAQVRALMADEATRSRGMHLALELEPPLREEVFAWFDRSRDEDLRRGLANSSQLFFIAPPGVARMTRWLRRAADEQEREGLLEWVMQSQDAALQLKLLEQRRGPEALRAALDGLDPWRCHDNEGVSCRQGALLAHLPALHEIVAARVRSGDAGVRDAAVAVMGRMPHEPTQRLLLEIAQGDPDEALRASARAALLAARPAVARDYILAQLERSPTDSALMEAYAAVMDEAGAQRLVDGVRGPAHDAALQLLAAAAPRACAPRRGELEALVVGCGEDRALEVLVLCAPERLIEEVSEARIAQCGAGRGLDLIHMMGERGAAAHLPVLDALAQEPRSFDVRGIAEYAARRLREALAKPWYVRQWRRPPVDGGVQTL